MRPFSALLASTFIFAASAALADTRVFIIANQADGYGVDQCLARGDKCGAHAARSYYGISRKPPPIAASIPTRSPARVRQAQENAPAAVAASMSRSPASAETVDQSVAWGTLSRAFATSGPRKRRDAAPRNG